MSIHSSAKADHRPILRVGVGAGAIAVVLATALSAPAAASVTPTLNPTPNQQTSTASEVLQSPVATSMLSSGEAVSDPQAGEGAGTTPSGDPVPPENSAGATNDDAPVKADTAVTGGRVIRHQYQVQQRPYWCSAAAARIALTARGITVSQAELARFMHVTHNGLPNIGNLRDALNHYTHSRFYQVKQWPNNGVLKSKLTADVRYDIDRGHAVMINVVRIGHAHFPGGHYATIVGYRNGGAQFAIADPASAKRQLIWLSADDVVGGIKLHRYVA
jgi:Peptidase_C39 like family